MKLLSAVNHKNNRADDFSFQSSPRAVTWNVLDRELANWLLTAAELWEETTKRIVIICAVVCVILLVQLSSCPFNTKASRVEADGWQFSVPLRGQ